MALRKLKPRTKPKSAGRVWPDSVAEWNGELIAKLTKPRGRRGRRREHKSRLLSTARLKAYLGEEGFARKLIPSFSTLGTMTSRRSDGHIDEVTPPEDAET